MIFSKYFTFHKFYMSQLSLSKKLTLKLWLRYPKKSTFLVNNIENKSIKISKWCLFSCLIIYIFSNAIAIGEAALLAVAHLLEAILGIFCLYRVAGGQRGHRGLVVLICRWGMRAPMQIVADFNRSRLDDSSPLETSFYNYQQNGEREELPQPVMINNVKEKGEGKGQIKDDSKVVENRTKGK